VPETEPLQDEGSVFYAGKEENGPPVPQKAFYSQLQHPLTFPYSNLSASADPIFKTDQLCQLTIHGQ